MPRFSTEVNVDEWVDADVDISVSDFFDEMDEYDMKEMANLLRRSGYSVGPEVESRAIDGQDFQEALRKLAAAYYSLSNEDIAPIMELAKRF